MLAAFPDFQAACDWIDGQTTPDNAGAFVIEQTAAEQWAIFPYPPSARPPLDTFTQTGQ